MRIVSATLQLTLIFGLVACSSSDREKTKEEARRDGQEAADEAKKAGREIKKDAKDLGNQLSAAVQPGDESASDKVARAGEKAKDAASHAGVDLDHAALLVRVKTKLASDAGLATLKNIDVTVTGTVVTLSGTVSNEDQKKAAVLATSQVQGVTQVQDRLTIQN